MEEPWYDYLAIPIAPLVLLVQLGALFMGPARRRWGISLACTAAIVGMIFFVDSRPVPPEEGVNIGAGVLLFWLMVSVALLAVGLLREVITFTARELRAESRRMRN